MENKVTSTEDVKKLKAKEGEVIELPGFDENTPFTARVKRPSLMELCKVGTIPNQLLSAAQKVFEGSINKANIKDYGEVIRKVVEIALVEPRYSEIKDVITDDQLIMIFDYTQKGVVALLPFREDRRRIEQDKLADKVLAEIISNSAKEKSKPSKDTKD